MLPVTRRRAGTTPTSLALVGPSVIAVAYGFSRYGFGLFLPTFSDEFALTAATAGAISSAGYASYLLSMLSAGALTARFGPRLPVVLGAGCASAGMALVALAPTGAVLAAGVTLAGASPGLCWAPFSDAVEVQVAAPLRARVLSVISTGTTFGLLIIGPLTWVLGPSTDAWRWAWGAFSLAAAACAVAAALLIPTPPAPREPARRGPAQASAEHSYSPGHAQGSSATEARTPALGWVQRRGTGRLLMLAAVYGFIVAVYFTFAVDLVTRAGLSDTWRLLLLTLLGLGGLSGLATGDLVTRFGLRNTLLGCLLLLAITIGGLPLAGDSTPLVAVLAVGYGLAYMPVAALLPLWSHHIYPDRPTSGFTITLSALALGSIAGPLAAGLVATHLGLPTTFALLAFLCLLSTALRPPKVHTAPPSS